MVLKNTNEYTKGRTIVYFVRHGDRMHLAHDKNAGFEKGGPGLSVLGKKQAKEVAKKLVRIKDEIDVLYSSSMTRALETAKEISKKINKKIIVYDELSEVNKIASSWKFYHPEFWRHYLKLIKAFNILNKILDKNKEKVIIIVAHGNLIRFLIGKKLGISLRKISLIDQENCHISKVRFLGRKLDYIPYINRRELL